MFHVVLNIQRDSASDLNQYSENDVSDTGSHLKVQRSVVDFIDHQIL